MTTGIDYLSGVDGIPVSELRFITKDETPDSALFPDCTARFGQFAASFCRKYGVAERAEAPVVLTPESLEIIRNYYDATDGRINRISDDQSAEILW